MSSKKRIFKIILSSLLAFVCVFAALPLDSLTVLAAYGPTTAQSTDNLNIILWDGTGSTVPSAGICSETGTSYGNQLYLTGPTTALNINIGQTIGLDANYGNTRNGYQTMATFESGMGWTGAYTMKLTGGSGANLYNVGSSNYGDGALRSAAGGYGSIAHFDTPILVNKWTPVSYTVGLQSTEHQTFRTHDGSGLTVYKDGSTDHYDYENPYNYNISHGDGETVLGHAGGASVISINNSDYYIGAGGAGGAALFLTGFHICAHGNSWFSNNSGSINGLNADAGIWYGYGQYVFSDDGRYLVNNRPYLTWNSNTNTVEYGGWATGNVSQIDTNLLLYPGMHGKLPACVSIYADLGAISITSNQRYFSGISVGYVYGSSTGAKAQVLAITSDGIMAPYGGISGLASREIDNGYYYYAPKDAGTSACWVDGQKNYGNGSAYMTCHYKQATLLAPSRIGYDFVGWEVSNDGGRTFRERSSHKASHHLYHHSTKPSTSV